MIDRERFRSLLDAAFPGTLARAAELSGEGLLHVELGVLLRATEEAMDSGHLWLAERQLRFIDRMWPEADPDVANAIDVSYLEGLAWTPVRSKVIRERAPRRLRELLKSYDPRWA
jgi:hypothetical protein